MAESFTWHEVSEAEKEQIKKDSKSLLEEFSSKLDKIKFKKSHYAPELRNSGYTEQWNNGDGFREEGTGWENDQDFTDLTLLNAPFVEENCIVAEKGGWK